LADAFTKDATKKTRQSERSVQRDATRAKKVAVLPDIAGTSLDKGAEIDVLAKLPVEKQRSLAEAATGPGGSNSCTRTPSAAHPRLWRRAADLAGAQGVRGTDRQRTGGGGCRSIPKNATVPAGLAFYRESRH
jgi:hypothetical protein